MDFTVGICATGQSTDLVPLVNTVRAEAESTPGRMRGLVIVASDCPGSILSEIQGLQAHDYRITLVVEDERRGKAEAVNRIMDLARGEFLVFVNSDAMPEPGAISKLVSVACADQTIGAVSAMPVVKPGSGLVAVLTDLMWTAHNECSIALNHMGQSNHSSDELVVFRRSAIGMLPPGLVNDGAFLASVAKRRGYAVKFSDAARVHIETPTRVSGLIVQRRRILFGHTQVWRKTGSPPKTIESLLLFSPAVGLRLLVGIVALRPKYLLMLPIASVTEVSATLLSILDSVRSTRKHAVWRRVT